MRMMICFEHGVGISGRVPQFTKSGGGLLEHPCLWNTMPIHNPEKQGRVIN